MSGQPPPRDDELDPTIAMPAVVVPPPRPRTEHGSLEPAPPVYPAAPPVRSAAPPQRPFAAAPVSAPAATVVPERPRFVFGNPVAYAVARFAALALDLLTVGVVATTFAYALIAVNPLTGLPTNSEGGFDATFGLGLIVALVYVWLSEALLGTTLWKLAFGLHVYPVRGRFVGLGRALLRNLLLPVDLLAIGGILALLPGHRRLGDLLGGTVVARSPLRAFAPLVGWIGIIALVGLPWVVVGPEHALAALVAFGEFVPRLIGGLWTSAAALVGGYTAH